MPTPPPTLVLCPDLESYAVVARAGGLPILGQPALLRGLPAHTQLCTHSDWRPTACTQPQSDPTRVCFALADEAACVAIASLLAAATGRSLVTAASDRWEAELDALLASTPLRSLTLIVPSWSDAAATPIWLKRTLTAIRSRFAKLERVAWGILTATDATTLSVLAAKSVLAPAIATSYRPHPSLIFTTGVAQGINLCVPRLNPARPAAIELVERTQFQSGEAKQVPDRSWSLMFFSDHGRGYCGAQGFLCGARPLTADPEAPTSCVAGMECVSPRDDAYMEGMAGYAQIDPRRYDTPILISDCCGSGNWSDPAWDAGHPSLAFHALAGAPSVVVTSDQVTFGLAGGYIEVFWALAASATVGEAVARLNHCRRNAAARFPFFVLGDPECPAGTERWPDWVTTVERDPDTQSIEVGVTERFVCVELPRTETPHTSFVQCESPGAKVVHAWSCRDWEREQLWLFLRRSASAPAKLRVKIERVPSLATDPALLRAAIELPMRTRHWHAADPATARRSPEIAKEIELLERAAELVIRTHRATVQLAERATIGRASDVEMSLRVTESHWTQAHAEVVDRVRKRVSPSGTWPPRIWINASPRAEPSAVACPYCGESPTLERVYETVLGRPRRAWECVSCVLIHDQLCDDPLTLTLDASAELRLGETAAATLTIDNSAGSERRLGAVAIYPDTRAHGICVGPIDRAIEIEVGPGKITTVSVELSLPERPRVYHRFYLRALVLLDGVWSIVARPITVRPD